MTNHPTEQVDRVAQALFCAIWESDEAWELATDSQKDTTREWARAALDAAEIVGIEE